MGPMQAKEVMSDGVMAMAAGILRELADETRVAAGHAGDVARHRHGRRECALLEVAELMREHKIKRVLGRAPNDEIRSMYAAALKRVEGIGGGEPRAHGVSFASRF